MDGTRAAPRPVPSLPPGRRPDGTARVPGSKSLTNRALVLGALASGRTVLRGALWSDDSAACAAGLCAAGVAVHAEPAAQRITVEGRGGGPAGPSADIDVRLSGTTARFLCPYLALGTGVYRVDGTARMRERPMGGLADLLRAQGVRVDGGPNLPFVIHGAGALAGGLLRVPADETSQTASGLLMAAPFARRPAVLRLESRRSDLPYVRMTAAMMAEFGVEAAPLADGDGYAVPAGARYRGREYAVEADASSAAYFWAAAAITGGRVRTPGVGRSRLQGDAALLGVLEAMGCAVREAGGGAVVAGPPGGRLRAGEWDLGGCSDQALTVAALGLFADGPTSVGGVAHIRLQESDRIAAAADAVRRLGGRFEAREDGFTVWPLDAVAGGPPAVIDPHGDHRVAMAFAVAGLRRPGVAVGDPGVVGKTFPDFFAELERFCEA